MALFSLRGYFKCRTNLKRVVTATVRYCSSVVSGKKHVNGVDLYYEQIGRGEHALLFVPGATGSTQTDFLHQKKLMNQDRFTMVFYDPRGYGRSRPPVRDYPIDFYERDANDAVGLMKALGFGKFSILGWCVGGTAAMIATAKNPDLVDKLILCGTLAFIIAEEITENQVLRDFTMWPEELRRPLENVYGRDYINKLWKNCLDGALQFAGRPQGICVDLLPLIKCPTLILHGEKDPVCLVSHGHFLQKHIKGSQLKLWPEGHHLLHDQDPDEFIKQVVDFLETDSLTEK